jgi:hypothetical protein
MLSSQARIQTSPAGKYSPTTRSTLETILLLEPEHLTPDYLPMTSTINTS